jgi:hypothetical protein
MAAMTDQERFEQVREEIHRRAKAVEENTVYPDQPTASGWLTAMWDELAALKVRLENLEAQRDT